MDIYVGRENAMEFFEKITLDNDFDNFNFTNKPSAKRESLPSFYAVNYRKSRGFRRTAAKNRFRGQRDGCYSERHENRAFNCYSKRNAFESCSSIIKRGNNDYIEEIEDEKLEKAEKIAKAQYTANLVKERNEAVFTLISCAKRINEISAELEKLTSE